MEIKTKPDKIAIKSAFEILLLLIFTVIGFWIIKERIVIVQGTVWLEGGVAVVFGVFVVAHMVLAMARMFLNFLQNKEVYIKNYWYVIILCGQILTFTALIFIILMN